MRVKVDIIKQLVREAISYYTPREILPIVNLPNDLVFQGSNGIVKASAIVGFEKWLPSFKTYDHGARRHINYHSQEVNKSPEGMVLSVIYTTDYHNVGYRSLDQRRLKVLNA